MTDLTDSTITIRSAAAVVSAALLREATAAASNTSFVTNQDEFTMARLAGLAVAFHTICIANGLDPLKYAVMMDAVIKGDGFKLDADDRDHPEIKEALSFAKGLASRGRSIQ